MIRFFRTEGSIASKFSKMFAGAPVPNSITPYKDADKAIVAEVAKMDPVVLIKQIFIDDGTINKELYDRYINNEYARFKLAERLCSSLYSMRDAEGNPILTREGEPTEGFYAHAISSALGNVGAATVSTDVKITEPDKAIFKEYIVKAFPDMETFIV